MEQRIIKFRGMDIKGNWHYGNVSILTQKVNQVEAGCYISNKAGLPFAYQVRPETVGQFVGLKDKNNKEIYEGDFLRQKSLDGDMTDIAIVEWSKHKMGFECSFKASSLTMALAEYIEIIGNITDNPELTQT